MNDGDKANHSVQLHFYFPVYFYKREGNTGSNSSISLLLTIFTN